MRMAMLLRTCIETIAWADLLACEYERSSLPSKNFPCISMDMLQIGALVLLGRLVEANLGFIQLEACQSLHWPPIIPQ